jgi:UPF0755 protein
MVSEAKRRFAAVIALHRERASALRSEFGFDEHDIIVFASMVQKETTRQSEMGAIASVFINRLRDEGFRPRAALQSDPTAGYGCKLADAPKSCDGFTGAITPKLLRDEHNRYNTYRHPGLPPGPVCNPASETVASVLTAPRTDYFYFVAGKDGNHIFSRTFGEHRSAVSGGD